MALLEQSASSFDEYVAAGGGRGLERALAMAPQQVIEEVALSGLRGRGGAGFPTGRKWLAVRSTGTGPRYVVCNAAEGEPATFKPRATNPFHGRAHRSIARPSSLPPARGVSGSRSKRRQESSTRRPR